MAFAPERSVQNLVLCESLVVEAQTATNKTLNHLSQPVLYLQKMKKPIYIPGFSTDGTLIRDPVEIE